MNKQGADKFLSIYWFLIIFLVTGAVVYMASLFYGSPYDVREIEADILTDRIADCFTSEGYLNEEIFSENFEENFSSACNLNFETEDFPDAGNLGQYYTEAEVYRFDTSPKEEYVGETETYVSTNLGEKLLDVSAGNQNWKTNSELIAPKKTFLSLNTRKIDTIVIHSTAGVSAENAIEALSGRGLSIHYIVERDGTILSVKNRNSPAFVPEDQLASHAGCGLGESQRPFCSEECLDEKGLLDESCQATNNPPDGSGCCIRGFNEKSIGIEVVNLVDLCSSPDIKPLAYCRDAVSIQGKEWESYPEIQISALANLVSEIAGRNNIPLDREHIIGHYQITNYRTDPGLAFYWDGFMQKLTSKTAPVPDEVPIIKAQRNFYAIDRDGNSYEIKILTFVGKVEKNA